MNYEAGMVVRLDVANPERERYVISQDDVDKVGDLLQFLWEEKITYRSSAVGGGQFHGFIHPEDWPKVQGWLQSNGFTYGSTEIRDDD